MRVMKELLFTKKAFPRNDGNALRCKTFTSWLILRQEPELPRQPELLRQGLLLL